jgi:hypothetical protein
MRPILMGNNSWSMPEPGKQFAINLSAIVANGPHDFWLFQAVIGDGGDGDINLQGDAVALAAYDPQHLLRPRPCGPKKKNPGELARPSGVDKSFSGRREKPDCPMTSRKVFRGGESPMVNSANGG